MILKYALLLFLIACVNAQESIDGALGVLNKGSVPYISVEALATSQGVTVLDTRKKEEFEVSHLEHAIWIGFREFNMDSIRAIIPEKDTPMVVYCSIGVRSEDIGEKLQKAAYANVKNLYGGIFEWKNRGFPVFDMDGNETEKVHVFNERWGKLLTVGEKVYSLGTDVETPKRRMREKRAN